MIEIAKSQNIPNTIFYCCDFFEFEPTEKYDAIIAFDSFFHFSKEKQNEIYHIITEWMNIGAYLLFTHGNKDGEITDYMYDEPFYYSSLDVNAVHKLLLENGFDIKVSMENYKETSSERDLLIIAKKIK
ncbi:MAG: class I SAM-dependent methyltransferase [Bacilli bacterium]|nr:class I SAM-dependent methyltransferase [Bacilli bacterium]